VINVEGPLIDVDQKRELVNKLTEVAVGVYGNKEIIVLVRENPPENVGYNGQLIADKNRTD